MTAWKAAPSERRTKGGHRRARTLETRGPSLALPLITASSTAPFFVAAALQNRAIFCENMSPADRCSAVTNQTQCENRLQQCIQNGHSGCGITAQSVRI